MINMIITKMTSKGQIVIPKEIRNLMNLTPGTKFEIRVNGKEIILRLIPNIEFEKLKVDIPEKTVSEIFKESRKLELEREEKLLKALGLE